MIPSVHLCWVLHNHQPIGNFEGSFEAAYQNCYLPFLDVFEPFESLAISLHTSGPLLLWLEQRHPEYLDRLRTLIAAGRIEILGGPRYEPILTMLPKRDRIGQIVSYSRWLERTLGVTVAGMWTPERVWETNLIPDLVAAGIRYTVLEDSQFRAAGLTDAQLTGYYLTDDEGSVLQIFPSSERLRRTVPVGPVRQTIDACWQVAQTQPGAVLTLSDAGEKFGGSPDSHRQVYRDGWLRTFFAALTDNAPWLRTITLADAIERTAAAGKIQLPDCSHRGMGEWALPAVQQSACQEAAEELSHTAAWETLRPFVRGGSWRNFRVKYAEANEMYAYMLYVSGRLSDAEAAGADRGLLAAARDHLYRGQSNGPYWHGTGGGIYSPHLRNANYHHLIRADAILDEALNSIGDGHAAGAMFAEAQVEDFDFDLLQEVRLASERATLWVAPGRGGRIYQWDLRDLGHNLLASLQRRPESHHRHLLEDAGQGDVPAVAFNGRTGYMHGGSEPQLAYDRYPRKSMMDHFYDADATLDQVASGAALERGDFVDSPFEAKLRRASDRVQLQMRRDGNAWGLPISITKAVTLTAGSDEVAVTYLLENLPPHRTFHFGVEFHFASLAAGTEDRFFSDTDGQRLGHLGSRLDLPNATGLAWQDRWLGLTVDLKLDRPSMLWAFPVETLNQSQRGFEWMQQSVCLLPHWNVRGDAAGRWAVRMTWRISTSPRDAAQMPLLQRSVEWSRAAVG